MTVRTIRVPLIVALCLVAVVSSMLPARAERAFGDVRIFAHVPKPGHPEGIAIAEGIVYVGVPATAEGMFAPALEPRRMFGFDLLSAELQSSDEIQGPAFGLGDVLRGVTPGAGSTVFVLQTPGGAVAPAYAARMLRLDYSTTPPTQTTYAEFPDLRPCFFGVTPCSPTALDLGPVPNFAAFDVDGTAYVSDTLQGVIWRVPAGGGTASIWFGDERLGTGLGPNGIALDTVGRRLYVNTSPSPVEGAVWSLPLVPTPAAADLQRFHTFTGVPSVPDGLAWGERGLYVAMASNQAIVILNASGSEIARIMLTQEPQPNRYTFPSPSNMAFDGTGRLLVANLDFNNPLGTGSAIFDVWVDDPGIALERPNV